MTPTKARQRRYAHLHLGLIPKRIPGDIMCECLTSIHSPQPRSIKKSGSKSLPRPNQKAEIRNRVSIRTRSCSHKSTNWLQPRRSSRLDTQIIRFRTLTSQPYSPTRLEWERHGCP